MESVEFWGIVFRSTSHMHWFQISMSAFAVSFIWYLVMVLAVEREVGFVSIQTFLWIILSIFHAVITLKSFEVIAFRFVEGQPLNGETFSTDCIWFNALMVFMYLSFCLIETILARRRQLI